MRRRQFRFVQAHVFCRHGDRTPGANFFEPRTDLASKEVSAWLPELLTVRNTRQLYAAFPLRVVKGQRRPRDEALGVFGSLTHRGLRQMKALGGSLRAHYGEFLSKGGAVGFDDVDCSSSNYRRTMHSAQALLGGLLPQYREIYGTPVREPTTFSEVDVDRDGWISAEEFEAAAAQQQATGEIPCVDVKVPRIDQAYINVYPLIPEIAELMRKLKKSMNTSQDDLDDQKRVQGELEDHIPAFGFKVLPFSWSQSLDLLESRLSRLHSSRHHKGRRALVATDATISQLFTFFDKQGRGEFSCKEFHAACLELFRDNVDKEDAETCFDVIARGKVNDAGENVVDFPMWQKFFANLQHSYESDSRLNLRHLLGHHRDVVERVVCDTFAHWYSDPRLCELVVGRMGRVVLPLMSAAAHGVSDDLADTEVDTSRAQDASIFLHVGHDVTIVPLLYALGGWQADHGWPKYAAAVRLDLFEELPETSPASASTSDDARAKGRSGNFFVHISYAQGFTALSEDDHGEDFKPRFIPVKGYRPPTALSSNAGTVGHADVVVEGEAKPLPGGFEEQLVAFEDFEKMLFFNQ